MSYLGEGEILCQLLRFYLPLSPLIISAQNNSVLVPSLLPDSAIFLSIQQTGEEGCYLG
jgi:hypothetical protein